MRQYIDLLENASIKAELEARFGNEDNYPLAYDPAYLDDAGYDDEDEPQDEEDIDRGPQQLGDHGDAAICTSWANYVCEQLPDRAKRFGFWVKENPAPSLARLCDGHDFAVVDERYIVDGWLKNVECVVDRAVFDIQDPADADVIRAYYGDPSKWKPFH